METIHNFLAAHACSKSDDNAFTFIEDNGEQSQITFGELHKKALSIAQFLSKDVSVGSRVVLLFPPGLEYIQAFLGCLYAGVIAVPLYPPQSKKHAGRVLTVIDDCQAEVVLTNHALKEQLEESLSPLMVLGFDDLVSSAAVGELSLPSAQNIAFLQYTSGSTGKPKGVVVTHGNIVANLRTLQQATECAEDDVFCNWLPLFHDLGLVNTLLLPIFLGAHSVLMSPVRFIKSPIVWFKAITEFKASICGAPNFAFDHCLERIKQHHLAGIDLSSWRIAFNAAEPVDADTLMRFCDRYARVGFKESAVFPAYGMAEATVFICGGAHKLAYTANPFSSDAIQKGSAQLPKDAEQQQVLIAHGHVQEHHQLKIVSPETFKEVADGQVGEIWFAGPSLAQGYWNDEEKTKASFGAKLENDEHRYLRTGDLGFIHNGELYISGRIKDVLIIKGRNYYPQDFEKLAYNIYPSLNQNGAAAFEVNGSAVLLLEVSRSEINDIDFEHASETIKAAIFEQFEVVLEEILFLKAGRINRTSSGKIQRALSKKRYVANDIDYLYSSAKGDTRVEVQRDSDNSALPENELEKQLCALWQEVLGLEKIGVEDNFLVLGGHSLLATTLVAQIQKKWQVDVSLKDFFTANTIRKLSKVIERETTSQKRAILPSQSTGPVPASFAQERMWLVNQIESERAQFNLSFAFKLFGELNPDYLKQAFDTVITRHQVLRTHYQEEAGKLYQQVKDTFVFDIEQIDLTALSHTEQQNQITLHCQQDAAKHFNLSEDLMLRVTLLKLNAQSHIMLLTMHHIATDGWSLGILSKELNVLYAAQTSGVDNPLADLDIQYADYAQWQRAQLSSEVLEEHLDYWKSQLCDLPVIHDLPLDYSRPAVQSFKGKTVCHNINKSVQDGLFELARQNNATLFMLLNAAFASFLSRYSGETDIVIGSAVANRVQSEVAPLMGLFINNLVLRSDLSEDPTFAELLAQSKERTLAAYEHQQLPFEKLVDELQPERNLSHSPLFQVMLILQNQEMSELSLKGLEVQQLKPEQCFSQYDLTLNITETENGLVIEWQYATDLFTQDTIERMIGHFELLLRGIINAPDSRISQLPLLGEEEANQVLFQWNETCRDYPENRCIHELFEAQVERTPDAIAVVFNNESLTYRQLNTTANQVAHYLVQKGVKSDSLVGICVERSVYMPIATLAVMKAGGAYLPLDPGYPKARLEYMIEDSGVQLILTQKQVSEVVPVATSLCLDIESLCEEFKVAENPLNSVNLDRNELQLGADNLAYVIYTSGSTGKPKGVMLEHRNLTNFLLSMQAEPGLTSEDCLLAVTSLSFDIHALELYLPLMTGGRLVIASSDAVASPEALEKLMAQHQVSCMQATPATWKMLVANNWQPVQPIKVLCGGEALSDDLKDALLASKSVELWNMYGPTETAVWSATQKIEAEVSLGKPIANTQFYVLDSSLNLVPVGVPGELYIGGAGVARGYFKRAELTAQRFIQSPFNKDTNERLYKTGDLVRWLPDGSLQYLRRADLQVKVRGHRIELGEVESTLKLLHQVNDAVVHVWHEQGTASLVAYVTTNSVFSDSELSTLLMEHLEASLPSYMIPGCFVNLAEIPLTPNGKVNRKALPKPQFQFEQEYLSPDSETERQLCLIWQELLNLEVAEGQFISVNSNFFHLGGHSLLAARLVSVIRQKWRVEIPMRTLFTAQTVRKLAQVIEKSSTSNVTEIVALADKKATPLSFAQQRLWLIEQIEGSSNQFNMCQAFKLTGELDQAAVATAFEKIVERHQVLRTTIQTTDSGEAIQVVSSDWAFTMPFADLSNLTELEKQQIVQSSIAEELSSPFDLGCDLMMRVKLLKLDEASHALLVTMHHIAIDGWSVSIIFEEFNRLYQNPEASLPDLKIQYGDYAHWQHEWLQGEVLQNHLDFWTAQLQDLPEVHHLALDRPRPPVLDHQGAHFLQNISAEVQIGLNELAKGSDTTLFMILQTALAVLLSRHSDKGGNPEDAGNIVIGSPVANREQNEVAPLVGFFTNSVVLQTRLHGDPSFAELLQDSKENLLNVYEHAQMPFEKLVDELKQERSLSYSPLFQVKLALQNNEQGWFDLPGISAQKIEQAHSVALHDLSLDIFELQNDGKAGGLKLDWEYATALFDCATIERMAAHFEVILKGIIDNPKAKVSDLPYLSSGEIEQLLHWSKYPTQENTRRLNSDANAVSVVELFEQQVAENPQNIAVHLDESLSANGNLSSESLTYEALNAKANQVAHYLIKQGVTPDTLVGLCVERSLEMIIGIWGILKAGGAYVPIDPDYPEKHIEHILDDSGIDIVLTSSELLSELPFDDLRILPLDEEMWEGFLGAYPEHNTDRAKLGLTLNHLAYVIYTSGSTGLPKGVAIEHGSLARSTMARFDLYQEQPRSFALFFSFAFDGSVTGIFWTLTTGAKLCIVDIKNGVDLVAFESLMAQQNISHFVTLPSVYANMLAADLKPSPALKMVLVAGEACDQSLVREHQSHAMWGQAELINEYGPTEACVWSSYYNCTSHEKGAVPIGMAAPHSELFVLDNDLQLCPVGVSGELYIGGNALARGYLNAPQVTAERFIQSPFDTTQRLYKTGDLVRCLPDEVGKPGNLEFLGRLDHQLKIRGFRIELGEIEAAISEHNDVAEAVVLARGTGSGENSKQLVAYVVCHQDSQAEDNPEASESTFRASLQTHLNKTLLSYKIPAVIVVVQALPRTPNGKVDRDALMAKEIPAQLVHQYVAPDSSIEKQLCELWQSLLKIEKVGITDNFFAIGGDSILSIQAVTQAGKQGLIFTTRDIFESQTIEKLAQKVIQGSDESGIMSSNDTQAIAVNVLLDEFGQWLESSGTAGNPAQSEDIAHSWQEFLNAEVEQGRLPSVKRDWYLNVSQPGLIALRHQYPNIAKLYPTTGMQQGMLYHSSMDQSAYVSQSLVTMVGELDVPAFIQALNDTLAHHDVFRTVFTEDFKYQMVLADSNLDVLQLDWSDANAEKQQQQIESYLAQDKVRGFDFRLAPLMRFTLIKLADERHGLIWSTHHVLSDGWSFPLIFKDVISLYEAATNGADIEVLPKVQPYENYIAWLQQQDHEKARTYWQHNLRDIESPTQIHVDRAPDGHAQGTRNQVLALQQNVSAQLQKVARQHQVTLNTIVQGAWAYLLHRYSGDDRVVFGETVSGRPADLEGVDQMVGLFINSLPVCCNIESDMEIGSWLKSLQRASIDRTEHGFLPLSEIQTLSSMNGYSTSGGVQPERNLFDTLVVFENYPVEQELEKTVINSALSVEDIRVNFQSTFGLLLSVLPEGSDNQQTFNFKLSYQAERFADATIARILKHLELILSGILDGSCQTVGELPLLSVAEQQQILVDWNDTSADYPQDKCIHQLFAEQAARYPEGTAIIAATPEHTTCQKLTNQQLLQKSESLALYLQNLGVTPDSLVGLCVDRSLAMMVAILGTMQAGGAYVPMDPDYPDDRLTFMLQDSQTSIVITQGRYKDKVSALVADDIKIIVLDETGGLSAECEAKIAGQDGVLSHQVKPQNLAYVIYTSGSTGKPKGVMIEHSMLIDYCYSVVGKMDLQQCETYGSVSSFSSDLGNIALFVPLIFGKSLYLFSDDYVNNPPALHEFMDANSIDCLKITPSHFEMFKTSDTQIIAPKKVLILAGEPLPKDVVRSVNTLNPQCKVFNNYGPTETTVSKLSSDALNIQELKDIVLGKPLNNAQVYILDKHNRPQPAGVPGELHIAGAGVARGYFNRDDLTQEKFVANPFAQPHHGESSAASRMYKTGDLVRWLEDGNIEYLGRIDTQVKIRGYRIETSEIEAQLNQSAKVKNCAVVVQGQNSNKQLVAFYTLEDAAKAQSEANNQLAEEFKAHLLKSLPDYMIPVSFVALEAIPLTPNGKVDRLSLQNMDVELMSTERYVAPRNELEKKLVAIWAEALELDPDKIGINDGFFELGGHSLLAIQVFLKLQGLEDAELTLKDILENNNIAKLAEFITKAEKNNKPTIEPVERANLAEQKMPLSSVQERMWFIDQLKPGSPDYNVAGGFVFHGEVAIAHLEQAFNIIIQRHENLRTIFPSQEGQPQLLILNTVDFKLDFTDLSEVNDSQMRNDKAMQICQELAAKPFDLAQGPLIRGMVIKLDTAEHVLMVSMHHIITDAWSQGLFIKEFSAIMDSLEKGRSPELKPLPVQYLDYSIWQRKMLSESEQLKQQLAYWQQKLADIPESLDLATDYPRPSVQDPAGDISEVFRLDAQLTSQLKGLAEQQGCTLYMTLLAIFNVLLYRYTNQQDICLGSPIANRELEETQDLIGMFVNTIVLRNQVHGDSSFIDFLEQVKTTCLEAFEHQSTPFEKVVDLVQPDRNMTVSSIFQIMFVMHNDNLESCPLDIQPYPVKSKFSRFDQIINLKETAGQIEGFIGYRTALFKASTIQRLAEHFVALCRAVVSTPDALISSLKYMAASEEQKLLIDNNNTQADYPKNKCIHHLFAEQVAQNPEKSALVQVGAEEQGSIPVSYQQLQEQSLHLALKLQSLGVEPDTLVGLCVGRSAEMMVGILGIMQAGGAYLPLDPEYPEERLSYMLQDSQTNIILTLKQHQEKLQTLATTGTHIIALDDSDNGASGDFEGDQASMQSQLRSDVQAHNLAYVIYTSGSTGQPKGVMIEHRMVVDYCYSAMRRMELQQCETFASVSTFSADLGNIALFVPILFSKTIYLFSDYFVKHPVRLKSYLDNHPIDCMKITPSHFEMFKLSDTDIVSPSKVLIFAGEPLTKQVVETVNILNPECRVFNNYGPTETTISKLSSAQLIANEIRSIPLGKPLDNTKLYVLDQHNQPQPTGVPGELHIAGDGVARGYLNRPELTQEKFVPNPFVNDAYSTASRMYKTGDLVRWLEDGNIEYLGRIDSQVKVRGYRIELSEIEAQLSLHPDVKECAVVVQGENARKQLVAFYTTAQASHTQIDEDVFKQYLMQSLPEYMVPARFAALDAIPVLLNGKINRLALQRINIEMAASEAVAKPRNQTEQKLLELWAEVLELELENIGITDNFFELGGHSLLAIMLVSKAVEEDIHFEIGDMFNYPNIKDLMDNCEIEDAREIVREEGILESEVALSPIQSYFFDRVKTDRHHFNQSVLLDLNTSISATDLQEFVQLLTEQHDALRFRYTLTESGWQQHYLGGDAMTAELLGIQNYDVSDIPCDARAKFVEETCNQWQASLDIEQGPVMRWVYFDAQGEGTDQLAIIVHHLMIDSISWRILLEDLNQLIAQRCNSEALQLSQKRSSYRDWVNSLAEYKNSAQGQKDLAYWVQQSDQSLQTKDAFEPKVYRNEDIQTHRVSLSEEHTQKLLKQCNQAYGTDINDLLLTAVTLSYYQVSGEKGLSVAMEGHGRDQINSAIDITKTVGWFTSIYPVRFELTEPHDLGKTIKSVKETLHSIPNRGVGYSIFRYINQDAEVCKIKAPQVKFNYLGEVQTNSGASAGHHIAYSKNSSGSPHSRLTEIDRHVTINGLTEMGQLSFSFSFPKEWQGQQISQWQTHFISVLEALVEHCCDAPRIGFSPSDFPLLDVTSDELDSVISDLQEKQNIPLDNIQDIYPLTALQSGILFETLFAKTQDNKGMYLQQFGFAIEGQANMESLQTAWQQVVAHYDSLRTQIITPDIVNTNTNVQVVLKQVELKVNRIDWTDKPHAELKAATEEWMKQSKRAGMDLHRAPLLRITVMQGKDSCFMVMEQHHLVTDGWSKNIVLSNVFKLYFALEQQKTYQIPTTVPYRAHVQALLQRDEKDEVLYWKEYLSAYQERAPLPMGEIGAHCNDSRGYFDTTRFTLSKEDTDNLEQFIKSHRLTMNTFLQFMWGLFLHLHGGNQSVTFGSVSSGRSSLIDTKHGDQLVGLCINTIPTCVQFAADVSLVDLLKQMQQRESDKIVYENTPLIRIQEMLGIKSNEDFFQTIFIFESYPVDEESTTSSLITDHIAASAPNYPLTVVGEPAELLSISFEYDTYYYDSQTIRMLKEQFERLILQIVASPYATIADIGFVSPTEKQQWLIDYNQTEADYPNNQCIHTLFEEQVAKTPDNIAVQHEQIQITYRELNEKANQLAVHLRDKYLVGPEKLVGLCLERSIEMMVAILAIFKAGGAYVPMATALPKARLQHLIKDTQMTVVLSDGTSANRLQEIKSEQGNDFVSLQLDKPELQAELAQYPVTNPIMGDISATNLAYVIYTSGSTGEPKGVMIEHMACLNHCFGMIDKLSLDSDCAIAQTSPISFDISVWQSITMLLVGGRTVIIRDEVVKSPVQLIEEVNNKAVTLLQMVPSLMNVVLDECEHNGRRFTTLRCCSVTGEACAIGLQNRWIEAFSNIPLINAYGPAECADDVLLYVAGDIRNREADIFTRRESQVRGYCRDYPSMFDTAVGSELFDVAGNRYLDMFCGAGALNYGHNNKILKSCLTEYVARDGITHSLDLFTRAKSDFLSAFERHVLNPRNLDYRVMFTGPTGTNTVEAALKLARKNTGRKTVMFCEKGYHGMTIGSLSVTRFKDRAGIPLHHTQQIEFVTQEEEYTGPALFKQVIESMEELPAAIILEVVQAEGGINVAHKQWLKDLSLYAKQRGIVLIVDDIQAGCGRTGRFFSFEHYGIQPDLVCLSKSISGYGLPMALLLIRPDLDIWGPAEHNGTFRGNNHAFITGTKALETYWHSSVFEQQVQDKTDYLQNGLQALLDKYPQLNGKRRGLGMMQGIEFASPLLATQIKHKVFEEKLIIETAGKNDETLKFLPALTMTIEQIQECLDIVERGIVGVTKGNSCTSALRINPVTMPVGKPLNNLRVYVVNEHHQPVPFGATGELLVAGDGLARGYFNQPELTASKFIEINIAERQERVYKTGDRVRFLADGNIEFMGRMDGQVKVRGIRIELGEIEACLSKYHKVKDCVVIAQGQESSKQLIAFYVAQVSSQAQTVELDSDELKAQLRKDLPEYMIPVAFVALEALPLTPNGKVDRRSLERRQVIIESKQCYLAPRNETEQKLTELWAQVLGLKPSNIGVNDNFFELGGHSLKATQLMSKITTQLDVELPLAALFNLPTIAGVAELIAAAMHQIDIPQVDGEVDQTEFEEGTL